MPVHLFFFFQAEDGIRYIGVTGVQTCALPISPSSATAPPPAPPSTGTPARSRAGPRRRRASPAPSGRRRAPPGRRRGPSPEIGRASGRERVEISVVAGLLKQTKNYAIQLLFQV